MENNENIITVPEDDDAIMPDGYADGDDIFDPESWSGTQTQADEPEGDSAPVEGEGAGEGTEAAPTTEPTETPDDNSADDEPAPTTEQDNQPAPNKLKFTARVDRADIDVEVDESELPAMYQKAQVVDRVQARLAKLTPQLEKAERLAKAMGFETVDDMLNSAENNFRDTEVSRLVGEGVHEEVAKDMVARRITERRAQAEPTETQTAEAEPAGAPADPAARDFKAEVAELLSVRQDLVGTTLPSEVVQASVKDGKRLLVAYLEYEQRQSKAENERLTKKVKVLEQNAAAAARSPVVGVSGGGPTDTKAEDDFEKGFNSIW